MVDRAFSANPKVLQWARVRAGLTLEAAALAIGRNAKTVKAWEDGTESPTFRQLSDLAQRVYRRPVAVFFFPVPPREDLITSEFRTLPQTERDQLEPDTLFALRDAKAWQLSARDVVGNANIGFRGTVAELRRHPREALPALSQKVRRALGIPIEQQTRWRSADEALKGWRSAVEQFGILVFKRPFHQENISGFCLDDPRHPVIVLNNSTSHTRQIFTLFHEIAHLAFGVSGVATRDEEDLESLTASDRRIEIACNQFAADILVPAELLDIDRILGEGVKEGVTRLARELNVSREVVLRRILDAGGIEPYQYEELTSAWRDDYLRRDAAAGGGSYYANVGTYLSETYARAVLHQVHSGRLGIGDAADYLRMKAQNIERFEAFLLSRGAAE